MCEKVRMIIAGSRPHTWALSVCPVIIAGLSAYLDRDHCGQLPRAIFYEDLVLLGLAVLVALSLQICANFVNDYLDGVRGVDTSRAADAPQRLNALPCGAHISHSCAWITAIIGIIAGCAAVWISQDYWLLGVGAVCVAAAWGYSSFLSARGFGELLAFVFFGPVLVFSVSVMLTERIGAYSIAASIQCGLVSALVMLINNMRDRVSDKKVHKNTIVVRWGIDKTVQGAHLCVFIVWAVNLMYALSVYHIMGTQLISDLGVLYLLTAAAVITVSWKALRCVRIAVYEQHYYRGAFIFMNQLMLALAVNYLLMFILLMAS